MDQVKRKFTFNQLSNEVTKKLQNNFARTITFIENLSNEIFYEIFDYLDGYEIYNTFSNLNHHFQQLLDSPSLILKIKLDNSTYNESSMNNYQQYLLRNKHKIFSIEFELSFEKNNHLSWFTFDLSLSRLESIYIGSNQSDILISLLINLADLPRLLSLTIRPLNILEYLNDIYRLIFALPVLKSFIFFLDRYVTISLPMAINQQLSTIEHLVTYQYCSVNELFIILSYIPQIRCLKIGNNLDIDTSIQTILPITLSNLVDISITMDDAKFDEFELFIRKIHAKLKILRVTIQSEHIDFLNAHQWEQLIFKSLPQLEEFYFRYIESFAEEYKYPGVSDQFITSFWIERQWTFEIKIDNESIDYIVRPYRKRWYEYTQDNILNSSVEYAKSTRLTIEYINDIDFDEVLQMDMTRILTVAQIYSLDIPVENVYVDVLIEIVRLLPELTTLKIHSLSLHKPIMLNFIQLSMNYTSKVRKVYLLTMNEIEEFSILLNLCPFMKYFKVDYTKQMDFKFLLQCILKKIKHDYNEYLRLLCFRVPTADDEMIQKLNRMIDLEKLLWNYKIKRVAENLYIEWL
ncbi:unnamed protein product [Rotaria sordida]|uniref:F-box domain-containing protein n=1 Tax=Rotaria sordida TaxID=392033 RepID=A0A815TJ65_9BILA|nr:unnamed protein product [Rotaria sordida]CAF4093521.1 unnamed protein product [Rotaria sordida]